MAHKGKHYEFMLRRDLNVFPDNPYNKPKRLIYKLDGLIVTDDPGANRTNKVSAPAVPFAGKNKVSWTFTYPGILLSTITITVTVEIIDKHGNEKWTWFQTSSGTPGTATWSITENLAMSSAPNWLLRFGPTLAKPPITNTGLNVTGWGLSALLFIDPKGY